MEATSFWEQMTGFGVGLVKTIGIGLSVKFSVGTYARLIAIILTVPIAMLLVGHIIKWVVRGFARPQG